MENFRLSQESLVKKQFDKTEAVTRGNVLTRAARGAVDLVERGTGVKHGEEKPGRLLMFVGGVTVASWATGQIPDHQIGFWASEVVAGAGGAFIGNATRVLSRPWRFSPKRFLQHLDQETLVKSDEDRLASDMLIKFFETLPEAKQSILSDDEIRLRLLDRLPNEAKHHKLVDDPRYAIVDKLQYEYRKNYLQGKKPKPEQRRGEKEYVSDIIMNAQRIALEHRAEKHTIRMYRLKRVLDVAAGVAVICAASAGIDNALNGTQGALAGVIDDLVSACGIFGSVAIKYLSEHSMSVNCEPGSNNGNVDINHERRPLIQNFVSHMPDQRDAINFFKRGKK